MQYALRAVTVVPQPQPQLRTRFWQSPLSQNDTCPTLRKQSICIAVNVTKSFRAIAIILTPTFLFSYLALPIASSGQLEKVVTVQVLKTHRVANCMNDYAWNNKYVKKDAKSILYKSVIRPLLVHGAEAWSQKRQVQATELRILINIVTRDETEYAVRILELVM